MNLGKIGRAAAVLSVLAFAIADPSRPARGGDDDPLPDVAAERLAGLIEEATKAYEKVLVEAKFDAEQIDSNSQWALPLQSIPPPPGFLEAPPAPSKPIKPIYYKYPGRFRHVADGVRSRTEYDSFFAGLWPIDASSPKVRWTSGFDGTIHYRTDFGPETIFLGESEPDAEKLSPVSLFWDGPESGPLSKCLSASRSEVTQKTVDRRRCYVVRSSDEEGTSDRFEAVISPRQSYLLLSLTVSQRGQVTHSFQLRDLERLPDGRWYPRRLIVEDRITTIDRKESVLEKKQETRILRFEPHHPGGPEEFAIAIPANTSILDRRTGTFYYNDPWWPEIAKYLGERFDWPRADLLPLDDFQSPEIDLEGQAPPPIKAERWLRGRPVDWKSLGGKVTLLVFLKPGDANGVPSLRRLAKAYGPSGLAVVEVMPNYAGVEGIDYLTRFVAEYAPDHPVLLEAPLEGRLGATSASFGVDYDDLPAAYLIDHEGKILAFAKGEWQRAVADQLRRAGAKDVAPLAAAETLNLGLRSFQFTRAWDDWTKSAPATARLVGTVVDAGGRPIAGAPIRARLFMTVLGGWKQTLMSDSPRSLEARTGPDGGFAFEGLCKGNYRIEISAPGMATKQTKALIPSSLGKVDIKIALTQSDKVGGVVRDEAGRVVPRARAELFNRHFKGPNETSFYPVELKKEAIADEDGRFRFQGLSEGAYSLRITAGGFEEQTREEVEAGSEKLSFALKPAKALLERKREESP